MGFDVQFGMFTGFDGQFVIITGSFMGFDGWFCMIMGFDRLGHLWGLIYSFSHYWGLVDTL